MSKTLKRVVVGIIGAACVVAPATALSYSKAEKQRARMTGGGHFQAREAGGGLVKVTHGFELHCRAATNPQRLQINWSGGKSFHLTAMRTASCSDDPTIDQEMPDAPIDTYRGSGSGRLHLGGGNFETGFAEWKFVDGGEPGGGADLIRLTIYNEAGEVILSRSTRPLVQGNHQAHRGTGSKA